MQVMPQQNKSTFKLPSVPCPIGVWATCMHVHTQTKLRSKSTACPPSVGVSCTYMNTQSRLQGSQVFTSQAVLMSSYRPLQQCDLASLLPAYLGRVRGQSLRGGRLGVCRWRGGACVWSTRPHLQQRETERKRE